MGKCASCQASMPPFRLKTLSKPALRAMVAASSVSASLIAGALVMSAVGSLSCSATTSSSGIWSVTGSTGLNALEEVYATAKVPGEITSANSSSNPQAITYKEATSQLKEIADYFLHHNRDISNRVDDSVIKIIKDRSYFYRRSRGYSPTTFPMVKALKTSTKILACGSQMKNSFALVKGDYLISSQYIGDLDNQKTYIDYEKQIDKQMSLFQIKPDVIVIDKHPEYLSSKFGKQFANQKNAELIEVQHHHAHMVACLYDNSILPDEALSIGIVFDGLGFGEDGTIWGGEVTVRSIFIFRGQYEQI